MRHPLRRKNLRARLLPLYALSALVLWLARPVPGGLVAGGLLVAAGAALRVWAAGHLEKNQRLTLEGPYRYVRHPLYLGSLLIGIGLATAAGGPALLAVLVLGVPVFALYYVPYKERIESARLQRRFGAAFLAYRAAVPALLPSPQLVLGADAPAGRAKRWTRARVGENDEFAILLVALAGLGVLVLRASVAA